MSEQLTKNNDEFNEILWNLHDDALLLINNEGELLDFNEKAISKFKSELNVTLEKGKDTFEIVKKAEKGLSKGSYLSYLKSADTFEFSFDLTPNYFIDVSAQNISFDNTTYKLVKIKDVSDKQFKLTGQKFYSKMLDQASDAIVITTNDLSDLKIQYVNKAFEQITGYAFEEIRGESPKVLQGLKTGREVLDRLKQNLSNGEDFIGQTINYKKNGEEFVNEWRITPLRDSEGKVIYYMAIIRDVTEQVEMKRELEKNEKQLRSIFENMAEGLVIHDKSGKIIEHNKAAQRVLDLTHDQLIGRDSFHPDWKTIREDGTVLPGKEHPSSQALSTGEIVENEILGVHQPSGEIRWLNVNSRPIFDDDAAIQSVVATFQDITEEFLARQKLKASEKKYRTLFNDNPNPIFITRPGSGKILSSNKAARKLYEYSKKELLSKNLKDFRALDHKKNKQPNDDVIHQTKNNLIYVNDHAKKIEYDSKQAEIHLIHDITNRKLVEQNLENSERQIRAMARNSPSAVFVTDEEGKCTMAYGTLFDKMGLNTDILIGITLTEFSEQYDVNVVSIDENPNEANEEIIIFKWEDYYLQTTRTRQFDETGEYTGMIGITIDITEQYRVKVELEQTARELNLGQKIAKIGTWRYDLSNGRLTWSEMTRDIHEVGDGFKPNVKKALGFYVKEDIPIISSAFKNLVANRKPYDLILRIITAKGNEKWVRSMSGYLEEEGGVTEVYGTFQDISDQKKLQDERLRLENIVKHTTNEIYIFNASTLHLSYLNESAETNLGYDKNKLSKLGIADIIYGFDNKRFRNEILQPLAKGQRKGKSLQFQHVRRNGSTYDVESTVQFMRINYDEVVVIVANDVTIKQRDKKRRNLINTVNELIVNSKDNNQSIDEIIAVISDILNLEGGEFWEYTQDQTFRQTNKWSSKAEMTRFLQINQNQEIPADKGVFEELIKNSEVSVFKKVLKKYFPKMTRVNQSLISCAVGFRVESKDKLHGVMLFYQTKFNNEILEFLNTLSIVSNQIAQFLHNQDITNQLIRSAEEKEILLREIHHRVKNNLQTVSSLLYLKSFDIKDENLSAFFVDTQNRISAISFTHEKLLKANRFRVLDIKSYLEDLIINIYNTHETGDRDIQIETNLLEIDLPTDVVMNLGLIINELITNSLQHAFGSQSKGLIYISFEEKGNWYELVVADDGQGVEQIPRKNSIGLQLVDIFVGQLRATMHRESDNGLKYKIKFKINGL